MIDGVYDNEIGTWCFYGYLWMLLWCCLSIYLDNQHIRIYCFELAAIEGYNNAVSFVNQLESIAVALNESATNGSITLEIDGVTYYPDPDSLDFSGDFDCAPGETAVAFVCGKYVLTLSTWILLQMLQDNMKD